METIEEDQNIEGDREVEPEGQEQIADHEQPESQRQLVEEIVAEPRADEEAFISRWLAERQCSGL